MNLCIKNFQLYDKLEFENFLQNNKIYSITTFKYKRILETEETVEMVDYWEVIYYVKEKQ